MTKIIYFVKDGEAEMRSFRPGGAELCEIRLLGVDEGIISFGPKSARIKGGVARIALSPLLDGDYTPRITSGGSQIYLPEVRKMGNKLTRPPVKPEILDRLYLRVSELERESEEFKDRLASLEKKVDSPFIITNQN